MLFNGLRPGEKRAKARGEEPAAHGGEECAARMVKTKADTLEIGGQTPIYLSKQFPPLIIPTRIVYFRFS